MPGTRLSHQQAGEGPGEQEENQQEDQSVGPQVVGQDLHRHAPREQAEADQGQLPLKLPAQEALFSVPRNLIKSFNLDLAAAGISKEDERGRTVDLHALRHTLDTQLNKTEVAPRTAQAAMRASSLDLTMNSARERREPTSRKGEARVPPGPILVGQAGCDGEAAHNVYTDPSLLDVAGAMEALPKLRFGDDAQTGSAGLARG